MLGSDVLIGNISVSYLTQDDSYDFSSHTISFASWKTSLAGREEFPVPVDPSQDIFSSAMNGTRPNPNEFNRIACNLVNSKKKVTFGFSAEKSPKEIRVDLEGGEGYQGYDKEKKSCISYKDMQMTISFV